MNEQDSNRQQGEPRPEDICPGCGAPSALYCQCGERWADLRIDQAAPSIATGLGIPPRREAEIGQALEQILEPQEVNPLVDLQHLTAAVRPRSLNELVYSFYWLGRLHEIEE